MSNPIKPNFKSEWFAVALIILAVIAGLYFYPLFPARVPTHWNIEGQANGYGTPFVAAFLLPIMMAALYLLFLVLPFIDPRRERYGEFAGAYHGFKDLIIFFLFIIFLLMGLNGLGYAVNVGFWAPILVGLLFIFIGALLAKVKMNWFLGIRTPWTLSSETVWTKTHRLSSRVLMLAGVLLGLTAFFNLAGKIVFFVLALALIVLGLPLYSYVLYAREKKGKGVKDGGGQGGGGKTGNDVAAIARPEAIEGKDEKRD